MRLRPGVVMTSVVLAGLLTVGLTSPVQGVTSSLASTVQVEKAVKAATSITSLPKGLTPSLQNAENDAAYEPSCQVATDQVTEGKCIFGDTTSTHTMVLVGDSHAGMWFGALNLIAQNSGWKLIFFEKSGCPTPDMNFWNVTDNAAYPQCVQWHSYIINRIKKIQPAVLVTTSADGGQYDGNDQPVTSQEWTTGLVKTLELASSPTTKDVIIGDMPYLTQDAANCLAAHETSVQSCSTPASTAVYSSSQAADQAAAQTVHALYINVVPWVCSSTCTAVVGNMLVYENQYHLSQTYTEHLAGALQSALAPVLTSS
jgi:hypothetical protein